MGDDGGDGSPARGLAVRLSEHLARTGRSAVVEVGRDPSGAETVELRVAPRRRADGGWEPETSFAWTVDSRHVDSQFLDLRRRIELILGTPPPAAPGGGPGWCQWE